MSPKSVLVTGCSAGGIGAAIALNLARGGHHVFVTARDTSRIPGELRGLPNVTVIQLDVTSKLSVAGAAELVADSGRGLDVLVNNAGAGYGMPILDMDVEKAQNLYDANVWGPVRCVQAFSDLLIKSRGRIVNMSTVGAAINMPWIGRPTPSSTETWIMPSADLRLPCSCLHIIQGRAHEHLGVPAPRALTARCHRCDHHGGYHNLPLPRQ